jgi:predicted DsbA family dithiol-disulfide isomerase
MNTPAVSTDATPQGVVIDVWSDLGCPWCYIGKHRLQRAIDSRPDSGAFTVRMRSFELDPHMSPIAAPVAETFVKKHGGTVAQFERIESRLAEQARGEGLEYVVDRPTANTHHVHRLNHLAAETSLDATVFGAVQDAYFAGRLDPFDHDALTRAAIAVGLEADRVCEVLSGDAYTAAVRADQKQAAEFGSTGVPFIVYGSQFATAGAQSVEGFTAALERLAPAPHQKVQA